MSLRTQIISAFLALALALSVNEPKALAAIPPIIPSCAKQYTKLFQAPVINVGIAIGYFDWSSKTQKGENGLPLRNVMGKAIQDQYRETLTAPCKSHQQKSCGFTVTGERPLVLTKTILGPKGDFKTLHVKIDYAALTSDDHANRNSPAQKENSARLESFYFDSLKNSEITFYTGHSRDGGGPDFDPAILNNLGDTDYHYYHQHPKDREAMLNALASNPEKTRIVGFLSCSSIRWFNTQVNQTSPSTGFIGSTGPLIMSKWADHFSAFFEKILNYECLEGFKDKDEFNDKIHVQAEKKWGVDNRDFTKTEFEFYQEYVPNLLNQLHSPNRTVRSLALNELTTVPLIYFTRDQLKTFFVANTKKSMGLMFNK